MCLSNITGSRIKLSTCVCWCVLCAKKYFAANTATHQRQFWYPIDHTISSIFLSKSVPWEICYDLKINKAHISMFTFFSLSLSIYLSFYVPLFCMHVSLPLPLHSQFYVFRHTNIVRFNSVIYFKTNTCQIQTQYVIKEDAMPPYNSC